MTVIFRWRKANMDSDISRHVEELFGRINGPLSFRFILQPVIATLLAIRAGMKDARTGHPPYFWSILTDPTNRNNLLRESWADVGKVFIMAVIIDLIYEIIVFRQFHPLQTLIVAITLALIPYVLLRGPVNRIAQRWQHRKEVRP
jgi:hypothetical protein